MFTTLILICALGTLPADCTIDTALGVASVKETCLGPGAQVALPRRALLDEHTYAKIMCTAGGGHEKAGRVLHTNRP